METRHSGLRFALSYLRLARNDLARGRLGDAIGHWGIANCHFGYTIGSTESVEHTLAARLLRHAIGRLGTRIEKAAEPEVRVDGWRVGEPIVETFVTLTDDYPIPTATIADLAAQAVVEINRRFDLKEKR